MKYKRQYQYLPKVELSKAEREDLDVLEEDYYALPQEIVREGGEFYFINRMINEHGELVKWRKRHINDAGGILL
jgi:hypothetical protein